MLDAVLGAPNADFRAWVESLPPSYWSRYDLSAARIGWEAASKFIQGNADEEAPPPLKSDCAETEKLMAVDHPRLVSLFEAPQPDGIRHNKTNV